MQDGKLLFIDQYISDLIDFYVDANVPSLVSIPYLGYVNNTNEVYRNTRKMLLNPEGNPYYGRSCFKIYKTICKSD